MNFDKTAFLKRAFEEIERVMESASPRPSLKEISRKIGRNDQFLAQLRSRPDTYTLSVEDLANLNAIYGVDDIYIIKGFRYQAIKAKLDQLRPLINSI